jgi:uncharacterized protein (DUF169 family)
LKEVIEMMNFAKTGEELDRLLNLRTPSLGIKFFEKIADITDEFEVIKDDVMVCQVIGMARYNESALAATKDSATACAMGGASLGLYAPPGNMLDGTRNAGAWAADADAAKKLMEGRVLIDEGKFEAFGVCPLKNMSVEPDVVQAFGTPEQMLAMVYANIWDGGDKLELSTNGHGGSCNEVLSVPYITGKARLALADIGEKRHAGAQDEMIIGIPFPQLERFVENLKKAYGAIYKYPFKPYFAPLPEAVLQRVSTKY